MQEPSDWLYEKLKHGRRYGRRLTFLAFGNEWTVLGCIDSNNNYYINNNNNNNNNNDNIIIIIIISIIIIMARLFTVIPPVKCYISSNDQMSFTLRLNTWRHVNSLI